MSAEAFESMLTGGHPNSLGRTLEVVERILGDPPVTSVELKALELDNIGALDSVESQFGFKPLELAKGLDYLKKA